jgi:hypothetical protein
LCHFHWMSLHQSNYHNNLFHNINNQHMKHTHKACTIEVFLCAAQTIWV